MRKKTSSSTKRVEERGVSFLNKSKLELKFVWGIIVTSMELGQKNLEEAPRHQSVCTWLEFQLQLQYLCKSQFNFTSTGYFDVITQHAVHETGMIKIAAQFLFPKLVHPDLKKTLKSGDLLQLLYDLVECFAQTKSYRLDAEVTV